MPVSFDAWLQSLGYARRNRAPHARSQVAGAIEHGKQYVFFRRCLSARLARLRAATSREDFDKLTSKVHALGSKEWIGALAELTAYDFFASFTKLRIDVTPPGPQLGAWLGRQPAVLDGLLPSHWSLHFDVKALQSVTTNVLEHLLEELGKQHGVALTADYARDLPHDAVTGKRRGEIRDVIVGAIAAGAVHVPFPGIGAIRIHRDRPEVRMSSGSYNAYRHAQARARWAISDANQLLLNEPNLRVFVSHPWYDSETLPFQGADQTFFRSLSRRVFCDLTKSRAPYAGSDSATELKDVTVGDVARRTSALLFLSDHSVESRKGADADDPRSIIDAFLYVNPNAERSRAVDMILSGLRANVRRLKVYDNFRHDNY